MASARSSDPFCSDHPVHHVYQAAFCDRCMSWHHTGTVRTSPVLSTESGGLRGTALPISYAQEEAVTEFIKKVIYKFEPKADKMIENKNDELANKMFEVSSDPNRSLFSEETTKKILSHISDEATSNVSE